MRSDPMTTVLTRPTKLHGRRLSAGDRAEAQAILAEPAMGFMNDASFSRADAAAGLFNSDAPLPEPNCAWYHPGIDAEYDRKQPLPAGNTLLNAAQERTIFLQFNFARSRAAALHQQLHSGGWDEDKAGELLYWHGKARELRDRIVEFNLALVLAMARHVAAAKLDFSDLVSEGNLALLRAVDKFDVSRKFKFSTYACRAILKAFSRMSVRAARQRAVFPTSFDPELEQPGESTDAATRDLHEYTREIRNVVETNSAGLTDLERQVIAHRFPMVDDRSTNPPTLQEVGQMVGYSKERIRQIQKQALDKIRSHMETAFAEAPFAGQG